MEVGFPRRIGLNSVWTSAESLEKISCAVFLSSLILVGRSLEVGSGRPYTMQLSLHRSRSVNSGRISDIGGESTVDVFDSRAKTL